MKNTEKQIVEPEKTLKVWGAGTMPLVNGIEIDAFVLDDGTPLIGSRKILKVLGRGEKGDYAKDNRPSFLSAKNLQEFIKEELEDKLKGLDILYSGKKYSVYHADILPLICDVYLAARLAKKLLPNQLQIAEQCEMLVRAFAKVGITALIYEQLGFEKFKHPDAFRILIESYLSEEIRKWSKEFPDELFYQMDRIYGNHRTTSRNRPMYYAKFLRKYIYEPIEKGKVLERLDERNPKNEKGNRSHRHHTLTSEKVGLPALKAQIWQVVGVLKTSSNKKKFEFNYNKLMGKSYQGDLFED